ncbi:hypothetical protein [uncultured Gilvimarinus sp.]|uniref:hypothetical protein n=1 Tax=uncultured Gilvimarinus sp. TaxID=1689143 RepID=UPI0030D6E807
MKYIVLIFTLLTSNNVLALSCIFPDKESSVKDSKDIFVGEVVEIISSKKVENDDPWDANHEIIARLKAHEIIRGDAKTFQNVRFSEKVSAGEHYIIFDKSAYSSWCSISLSKKLEDAGWYLKILNYESSSYNRVAGGV